MLTKKTHRITCVLITLIYINLIPITCFSAIIGDINGDDTVDLFEAMFALQVSAGVHPPAFGGNGDINGDGKIDPVEAIYALQVSVGIRTPISDTFGEIHTGQYHLGPVDFGETDWHNACAPDDGYRAELFNSVGLGGEYLAGVSNIYNEGGAVCGRCVRIITATNRTIIARVVTYGINPA